MKPKPKFDPRQFDQILQKVVHCAFMCGTGEADEYNKLLKASDIAQERLRNYVIGLLK